MLVNPLANLVTVGVIEEDIVFVDGRCRDRGGGDRRLGSHGDGGCNRCAGCIRAVDGQGHIILRIRFRRGGCDRQFGAVDDLIAGMDFDVAVHHGDGRVFTFGKGDDNLLLVLILQVAVAVGVGADNAFQQFDRGCNVVHAVRVVASVVAAFAVKRKRLCLRDGRFNGFRGVAVKARDRKHSLCSLQRVVVVGVVRVGAGNRIVRRRVGHSASHNRKLVVRSIGGRAVVPAGEGIVEIVIGCLFGAAGIGRSRAVEIARGGCGAVDTPRHGVAAQCGRKLRRVVRIAGDRHDCR